MTSNMSNMAAPTMPYSYTSPHILYAMDVLPELPIYRPDSVQPSLHMAVGTLQETGANKLQIVSLSNSGEDDQQQLELSVAAEEDVIFPFTKVMGQVNRSDHGRGLLATTSDMLRVWRYVEDGDIKLTMEAELCSGKSDMLAPLTSFDWSEIKASLVVTCSVDTTCTVWDIETRQAKTQLIAHDREVYDVAFVAGSADIFASVGADGSVRMFDLRSLDHSSIIYESPATELHPQAPLLRLACNRKNANYMATFHMESSIVQVLDARMPGTPFVELQGHTEPLTGITWSPQEEYTLCSCGEDGQIIIWDIKQALSGKLPNSATSPTSPSTPLVSPKGKFSHSFEANNVAWSRARPDWIAVTSARSLLALHV
ncbi:WD40-repeat-containing domain protein [Syncephalis fuscata]|nr:WD40-repeat-containing domain protein [Syncephalis fuscata]